MVNAVSLPLSDIVIVASAEFFDEGQTSGRTEECLRCGTDSNRCTKLTRQMYDD